MSDDVTSRLAVNINADCTDVLRQIQQARGISTTEAVRRAIGLLGFFEAAAQTAARIPADTPLELALAHVRDDLIVHQDESGAWDEWADIRTADLRVVLAALDRIRAAGDALAAKAEGVSENINDVFEFHAEILDDGVHEWREATGPEAR